MLVFPIFGDSISLEVYKGLGWTITSFFVIVLIVEFAALVI